MMERKNVSNDNLEDIMFLKEIRQQKRDENEPSRWDYVVKVLKEKGYSPIQDHAQKCIRFELRGNMVTVWPYKGWFSGKGVKDGRGIKKLLRQI